MPNLRPRRWRPVRRCSPFSSAAVRPCGGSGRNCCRPKCLAAKDRTGLVPPPSVHSCIDVTVPRLFTALIEAYHRKLMKAAGSTTLPARPLALANLLTYSRIAAVPVVVGLMFWQSIMDGGLYLRWFALAVFITAGITDMLDGYV